MADRDSTKIGEFAISLAHALVALRKAADSGNSVTLTGEQAKAVVDAVRMLNKPQEPNE